MKSLWINNNLVKRAQYIRVILKVTISLTPYLLFQWFLLKVNFFLLNLSTKCWNSAFNAQGSIVLTVVLRVGAMKICVAAVEALRKKEGQDETQFTTKICGKSSLGSSYFVL
jgi:hypothetical protein